ncbi:MAG: thioredoxin family protein [Candidatus Melainabacteria bacterium]|nr:thioredoxin family protein [Candidatus Melainabacteria bacterium]
MNSKRRGNSWVLAALCIGLTVGSASAQTSAEGVQLYKSGKYGPALEIFEALAKKKPTDTMTHYYIALCSHGMNQTARASQEYQWVVNNSRGALKTAAQNGLDSVTRYKSGRTAQIAAGAANVEAKKAAVTATGAAASAAAAKAKTAAAAPAPKGALKCAKVLEFSTDWCRVCKQFEPAFEAVKNKFSGKVKLETLNAEDSANAALVAKYQVSAYPTLVYLDANGTVLKNQSGCPADADSFAEEIESFK